MKRGIQRLPFSYPLPPGLPPSRRNRKRQWQLPFGFPVWWCVNIVPAVSRALRLCWRRFNSTNPMAGRSMAVAVWGNVAMGQWCGFCQKMCGIGGFSRMLCPGLWPNTCKAARRSPSCSILCGPNHLHRSGNMQGLSAQFQGANGPNSARHRVGCSKLRLWV